MCTSLSCCLYSVSFSLLSNYLEFRMSMGSIPHRWTTWGECFIEVEALTGRIKVSRHCCNEDFAVLKKCWSSRTSLLTQKEINHLNSSSKTLLAADVWVWFSVLLLNSRLWSWSTRRSTCWVSLSISHSSRRSIPTVLYLFRLLSISKCRWNASLPVSKGKTIRYPEPPKGQSDPLPLESSLRYRW